MIGRSLREVQAREKKASEMLATEKGRAARAAADHDAELRRLRARLAEAEATVGCRPPDGQGGPLGRRRAAVAAAGDDRAGRRRAAPRAGAGAHRRAAGRLRRRERTPTGRAPPSTARALDADDPARLDQLLALPRAHLVVDGYNVTKRGFGEMSLEQQRKRLITGLGGIAAQTGAEVTVRLRRRGAGARPAAGAARRARAVLPQGRDGRRADPAAGPRRAGRAGRWSSSRRTARSPTAYAGTAPTRSAPTRCCGGSPAPDRYQAISPIAQLRPEPMPSRATRSPARSRPASSSLESTIGSAAGPMLPCSG